MTYETRLALALLVASVGADYTYATVATDNLAVAADLLDGRTNLHFHSLRNLG